jgi:hypothetical protein
MQQCLLGHCRIAVQQRRDFVIARASHGRVGVEEATADSLEQDGSPLW